MVAIQANAPGPAGAAPSGGAGAPDHAGETDDVRGQRIQTGLQTDEAFQLGLNAPLQFVLSPKIQLPPEIKADSSDGDILAALSNSHILTDPQLKYIATHFSESDRALIYHQIADAARYRVASEEINKTGIVTPEQEKLLARQLGAGVAGAVPASALPDVIPPPGGSLAALDKLPPGTPTSSAAIKSAAEKYHLDPEQLATDVLHAAAVINGKGTDPDVTGPLFNPQGSQTGGSAPPPGSSTTGSSPTGSTTGPGSSGKPGDPGTTVSTDKDKGFHFHWTVTRPDGTKEEVSIDVNWGGMGGRLPFPGGWGQRPHQGHPLH